MNSPDTPTVVNIHPSRTPGRLKGRFDDPLPEDELAGWSRRAARAPLDTHALRSGGSLPTPGS
ncbi:MAG: hypothetical protein LT102_10950 [Burkholderiaceae bacterium]|nr:hypothetical protein [Burkholderiaceae bacterium]